MPGVRELTEEKPERRLKKEKKKKKDIRKISHVRRIAYTIANSEMEEIT